MKFYNPRRFGWLFLICLLSLEGAAPLGARDASQFKIGEPFPNIVLPSLENGQPASMTQFRGKKLILHIFASW